MITPNMVYSRFTQAECVYRASKNTTSCGHCESKEAEPQNTNSRHSQLTYYIVDLNTFV